MEANGERAAKHTELTRLKKLAWSKLVAALRPPESAPALPLPPLISAAASEDGSALGTGYLVHFNHAAGSTVGSMTSSSGCRNQLRNVEEERSGSLRTM